jgi:hypothetical protein
LLCYIFLSSILFSFPLGPYFPPWSSGQSSCYRSRGPGSIPGATRFSEKWWVWNGVHSASWVQLRSYLKGKVAAPVQKSENTAVEIRCTDHATPSIRKSCH